MYSLANVSKSYRQGRRTVAALDDVTLDIPDGQFVAVQGPTGGGKSTLLQLLGALEPPTTGTIAFGDDEISALGRGRLTRLRGSEIGFVFQSFNLIPTLTAQENVESALVPGRLSAGERRRRAREALEAVGLGERAGHRPAELSGGQQQRVAIARAIVTRPKVLLADEPTGNLDEQTRDEIMGLLESLWREQGLTLVVVTHDSAVAARAERRLRLRGGRVEEQDARAA